MKTTNTTNYSARSIAPVGHLPYVPSSERTQPARNILRATGSGRVSAAPDYAVVSMSMSSTHQTYTGAIDELNRETGVIVRSLLNSGLRRQDIRTRQYRIGPETNIRDNSETFVGYRAAHKIEVRIPATIADIRSVYLTLKHEVDEIDLRPRPRVQISFHVRDEDRLAKEALARALEDATGKALTMARTQGCFLENVINIEAPESGIFVHKPSYVLETRESVGQSQPLTPETFAPKEIRVERVASLTFAMSQVEAEMDGVAA